MNKNVKSLLFVPARDKMLARIPQMNADVFIIDLEDSIPEEEKEEALNRTISFIGGLASTSNIVVRINSNRAGRELTKLANFSEIGIMLPKYEKTNPYDEYKEVLQGHYSIAMIETPSAIVDLCDITKVGYLNALAFGAEDYTAKVNMENNVDYLVFQKSMLVTYAKVHDLQVYDTPSFKLDNEAEFEREVKNAVSLGFDGKMAISPKHIQFINESFGSNDLEYMKSIITRYEADGNAVVVIDGKVYEKMHINRFKRIIRENS
jgi:citrate lyase subunit beta/citryl-CoA lyase